MSLLNSNFPNRILVTGAGGDIGLGIGKVLKLMNAQYIFGTDLSRDNAGPILFDGFSDLPIASATDYLPRLTHLVESHEIELVIPTSEAEIEILCHALPDQELAGVKILMVNRNIVDISLDKLRTANFLKTNNLPHPWTVKREEQPRNLPCIYKPRFGRGSKDVRIRYPGEEFAQPDNDDAIWQELLLPASEEYTCGVFRTDHNNIRTITLRRTLSGGLTGKGEVVDNPEITEYVQTIADQLGLVGSINMQLRNTKDGPVLFEINPRLSSTVVFRHKLGFTDLKWWIEHCFNLCLTEYVPPESGIKFYRGFTEYFDYEHKTSNH